MSSHVYEVLIRGRMRPELMVYFTDWKVHTEADGLTRLTGGALDQSQLLGILAALDDLHTEIVSINRLPS